MSYKGYNNDTNVYGGIGFLEALQLAFIVLKLLNVIDWSWGWVLAPTWVPVAIILTVALIWILLVKLGSK